MGIIQRQSIQASIITYVGALLGYLNFFLLYPRFLTPNEFGLTRVLINVAVLFSQLALLGVSYTILRFFPYFNNKKEKHYGILTYSILVSLAGFILFAILFYIFSEPIRDFFQKKSPLFSEHYFYIYPLAFFLMAFEVLFFYARSLLKTVVPILIKEVFLRILQTFAIGLFALKIIDFYGFLLAFLATYFLHYLIIISYLAFLKQLFWLSSIRIHQIMPQSKLNRYGLFVYAASIASVYTNSIDTIMMGALAGLTETGVYSVAFFIGAIVVIPSRTMNQVAIPIIAEAWKNNDIKKLQQLYKQTAINQFIIGAFILLLLWINIDLLLSFLPPLYHEAKWAMLIIGFARLLDMAMGCNGEIILYSKHVKFNLATNVLLIFVSTITIYILIPIYGVIGAAISIPIAYIFYNGIRIIFLRVLYKIQPFSIDNLKVLLIFSFLFAITFIIPTGLNLWVRSIGLSIILGAIFIVANLYLKTSEEVEKEFQKLKTRFL